MGGLMIDREGGCVSRAWREGFDDDGWDGMGWDGEERGGEVWVDG